MRKLRLNFYDLSEEYDTLKELRKTFAHNPQAQKDIVKLHAIATESINKKVEDMGGVKNFMDEVRECATNDKSKMSLTLKGLHEINDGPTTQTNIFLEQ